MKKLALTLSLALMAGAATVHAAGDAAAGKARSAACAGCHGADGNSAMPNFPSLAGQHADYIAKQLADFKSGARADAVMAGQAAGLSDEDMADLGAFYASQKPKGNTADETQVEFGEKLWRAGNAKSSVPACMACHSINGNGNAAAKFPRIAGQHADYTVKALKDFAAGNRANDGGAMMRNIAARMTDAEMQAVAEYAAGLQ